MEGQNSDNQQLNDKAPNRLAGWGYVYHGFFTEAYFLASLIAACAAASLAMGTRNGLQET